MESHIKIRCTILEMEDLSDNGGNISVRYYKFIKPCLCECTVRHKELEKPLKGTYSFTRLKEKLR